MSEEIIIDGVNVAECYYMYDNEDLNYMCQNGIGTCICRENKNCYYKQLQRLQAENEQLKEEIALLNKNKCNKCDFQKQYFDETKRLMNINHKLRLGCLECEYKNTKADVDKYRKALEEIRSYVNTQLDGFGNDVYGITKNQITTITNKINEVLK